MIPINKGKVMSNVKKICIENVCIINYNKLTIRRKGTFTGCLEDSNWNYIVEEIRLEEGIRITVGIFNECKKF